MKTFFKLMLISILFVAFSTNLNAQSFMTNTYSSQSNVNETPVTYVTNVTTTVQTVNPYQTKNDYNYSLLLQNATDNSFIDSPTNNNNLNNQLNNSYNSTLKSIKDIEKSTYNTVTSQYNSPSYSIYKTSSDNKTIILLE